jgi:uncharacterized OB-fold protein
VITSFSLATVLRRSKVSASGFAPYFLAVIGLENSERGINATTINKPKQ